MKKILILFAITLILGAISCSKDNKNSDNEKTDNPYSLQDDKDVFLLPPITTEKAIEFLKSKYNDVEYCLLSIEEACTEKVIINGKHTVDGVRKLIFKRGKKYPITLYNFTCKEGQKKIMILGVRDDGSIFEIRDRVLKGLTEKVVEGKRVVYGYIDLTEY